MDRSKRDAFFKFSIFPEYVLKMAKENDVKFIRLWFADILGFLKGFVITIDELEVALEKKMAFDSSSIQGYARIDESDMVAKLEPKTFQVVSSDCSLRRTGWCL
jgi:glutamine synthetase